MFNVLVTASGTAWETDQLMRMDSRRFKESSGTEAVSVEIAKPETLRVLEQVPTLLMYELGSERPNVGVVRYGRVRVINLVNALCWPRALDEKKDADLRRQLFYKSAD